ncbi:MAG TPA: neocarzinostatin apoprotein domain-containing protein [Candidatus Nanopelagicales bacterium]
MPAVAGRRRLGCLIVSMLLAVAAAMWGAGPAFAAVAITVSKTTGLDPAGETVTVNGTGFTPGIQLYLVACNPAIPAGGACDLANFSLVSVTSDGSWTSKLKVVARFGTVNCLTTACAIQTSRVGDGKDVSQQALQALTFTGQKVPAFSGPVPSSVATSTPSASVPATPSDSAVASPRNSEVAASSAAAGSDGSLWIVVAVVVVVALIGGGVVYRRRHGSTS